MKIKEIIINNFRGIKELKLEFNVNEPRVFIGINGVGKSTILDAVAILLSPFFGILTDEDNYGAILKKEDINNSSFQTKLEIIIIDDKNEEFTWDIRFNGLDLENFISDMLDVEDWIFNIKENLQKDPLINLPLAVYYLTNRAVLDIPLRIKKKHLFVDQFNAYDNALIASKTDFRIFFEWFREKEDLENEVRLEGNNDYRDKQLQAVRQAISSLMPDFSNLRVKRSPLRMIVNKKGEELIINQLSDGEKCLLAMVGDLARRLAIANPNLPLPLEGNAIVLIDEIELHLHPKWQREIVPNLTKIFPNCQFIITTHSPQVISHVKPENISILEVTNQGILVKTPENSFGRDSNRILEDLMETPARPQEIKTNLLDLFKLIDEGNIAQAKELKDNIINQIGYDEPELTKADILIRRKEILGK